MSRTILAATAAMVAATAIAANARAAGLYVSDRGVRPLGRGGAFVAGADDLGAIWYNPAGIVDAPSGVLMDATWLHYTSDFTRESQTTSSTGTTFVQSFPKVSGSTPFLPIPTIAGSYRFGDAQQYAVAFGVYAPMTPIISYPQTTDSGAPSPQRYSVVSMDGSALVTLGGYFAWKPVEELRIGGGLQLMTGSFRTTVDFSACPPNNLVCAGEAPSYDAFAQLNAGPIFAPSGNFGGIYAPIKQVRLGASVQLPFWVDAPAKTDFRMPSAVVFDNASQQGEDARVKFELPPVLRLGVEVRPLDDDRQDLRIELAYVREFWSAHQSIDIVPTNIQLLHVTGFPSPFGVTSTISIPRGGQDSNSIRLGGEYTMPLLDDVRSQLRAGVAYETSGVKEAYVSPLTIDNNKVQISIGGGLLIGKHLRLDAVYSHVFVSDLTVTPQEAASPRINPVQGNPTQTAAVNGGQYSARADAIGGGLQYLF